MFWFNRGKPDNLIGQILDRRYRVEQKLGHGGFGDTYLVVDTQSENKLKRVIKHFQPKNSEPENYPKLQEMFRREIAILEALGEEHPSKQIPRVLGKFEQWQEFFYVQEFVDGMVLKQEMRSLLNESQTRQLLREILEVLSFVHQKKVIHRDLKPDNIMRRKADHKIVLIDFGAVKQLQGAIIGRNQQVQSSLIIYTPGYAPNEQMRGQAVSATDVYAVGMIGIQALTGQIYEPNADGKVEWRKSNVSVSSEFAVILDKMVQDRASDRYASALEALAAINQLSTAPAIFQPIPQPTIVVSDPPAIVVAESRTIDVNNLRSRQQQTIRHISPRFQEEEKQLILEIDRKNRLDLVRIPAGKFTMGMPASERKIALENAKKYNWSNAETWLDWSTPQHEVKVPAFWMGKYTVTNAQWQALMGTKPSESFNVKFQDKNQPVINVSWDNCREFCKRLSAKTNKNVRLPSEAEWEYACRAGTTTAFHFGKNITPDLVNYDGNYPYGDAAKGEYRQRTVDVNFDRFSPNAWGLYQMHGNVWEWCEDVWHENYNGAPLDGSAWLTGGEQNTRALRGGSWFCNAINCRSANRDWDSADNSLNHVSFRVVFA